MDYQIPELKDHLDHIQAARNKLLRTSNYLLAGEWLSAILIGFVGWSIYILYTQWAATITGFDTYTKVALSGIAVVIFSVPVILTLFCEMRRDSLKRDAAISEMRIDIIFGVHSAIREFFGVALPEYSKHLTGFGLAEELLQITNQMSARTEKAYLATTQALEQLESYNGIRGIRHETLKAQALAELIKGLLETLSKHKEVLSAAEVDSELEQVVLDFEKMVMAAE